MARLNLEAAYIYSIRSEIRTVIRDTLKSVGFEAGAIHNITKVKEGLRAMDEHRFALLILDWHLGPDKIQKILEHNRENNMLDSHPTYLIAPREDDKIIEFAKEYYILKCTVGNINIDTIKNEIKSIIHDYKNLSPVRQVLINLEQMKKTDNYDAVQETLDKLLTHYPNNPRILIEVAESYISRNEWHAAEVILKPHAIANSDNARLQHLYARCCLQEGRRDEAIDVLKSANSISPYNTERIIELGDVYLENEEIDKALATYDDVLDFAPESKDAKKSKGKGLLLAGESTQAISLLKACGSVRELSAVFNTAAILAIRQNKQSQAFTLYRKALGLLTKNDRLSAKVFFNVGLAFLIENNKEKGLKCFEKALTLDPNFTKARHNINVLTKPELSQAAKSARPSSNKQSKINNPNLADFEDNLGLDDFEDETVVDLGTQESVDTEIKELNFDGEEDFDMDGIFEGLDDFNL